MSLSFRLLLTALLLAALAGGQNRRIPRMPPEIVVAPEYEAAPPHFTIELDNPRMRVGRGRLGGLASIRSGSLWAAGGQQGLLLVAITPLDLRIVGNDGKTQDIHLAAGRTAWFAGAPFALQNLSAEDCEFLAIDARR
jgi:hypothetical protein